MSGSCADAGDGDHVQGAVELAVTAAVQAVAVAVAGGGWDRSGAGLARELSVGGEAFGAGGAPDQGRGDERSAAGFGSSCGRCARTRARSSRCSASASRVSWRMRATSSRATRTRAAGGQPRSRGRRGPVARGGPGSAWAGSLPDRGRGRRDASAGGSARGCVRRRGRRDGPRAAGSPSRARLGTRPGSGRCPRAGRRGRQPARRSGRDLPGSRSPRREPPMSRGATRITRSPADTSACSRRRETCRQSSIAHTRSRSSRRAQRSAARCPASSAPTVRSPTRAPVAPVDGRQRVRALVGVRPDHDHLSGLLSRRQRRCMRDRPADTSQSGRSHAPELLRCVNAVEVCSLSVRGR